MCKIGDIATPQNSLTKITCYRRKALLIVFAISNYYLYDNVISKTILFYLTGYLLSVKRKLFGNILNVIEIR